MKGNSILGHTDQEGFMSRRTTSIRAASLWIMLWIMLASAQTPPQVTAKPEAPVARADMAQALRELMKKDRPNKPAACAIPLIEVRIAKGAARMTIDPMPILRPNKLVEPMPLVPLPAPPCKEEKR